MLEASIPLSTALPLSGAAITLVCGPAPRRVVLYGLLGFLVCFHCVLVAAVADGGVLAVHIGDHPGGIAVTLAVDVFSALMLAATAALILLCVVFAASTGDERRPGFAPLVLILTAGASGVLTTSDLFNLFVFLEVALLPSYVLFMMSEAPQRRAAARVYITTSLLASTTFLFGVALVYGSAGTTNLAALSTAQVQAPAAVVLTALAVKSALAPFHGWVAQSYPYASVAVAALFSVLHTKLALYAIYRVYTLMLDGEPAYAAIAVGVSALSIAVGAVAALGSTAMRPILSFGLVSTNGYIALGAVLAGPSGLTAGVFYLLNAMVVKGALFTAAGAVEREYGTGRLAELTGVARRRPLMAVAFMVPALALAGMPPFSGFVAKFALVRAAFDAGRYTAAAIAAAASLVVLAAMMKIWRRAFVSDHEPGPPVTSARPTLMAVPLILGAATVVLGLGGEWLLGLCEQAGRGLAEPTRYVKAVLGP